MQLKFWAPTFLLIVTTLLNADDDSRMRNIENRITSLEGSQNGCCVINPSARPFTERCFGLYFSIDPLLWQANVGGLPIAVETKGASSFFNGEGESRVSNISFDWDFGARVGVGLNTLHDGWDILLEWTHFTTEGSRHLSLNGNNALYPAQGHPASTLGQMPATTSSKWDLSYNILDLENGREFYVSKCLTLRPFAGLRSAWINQELNVNYIDIAANSNPGNPSTVHIVDKEDKTWGIGILGGIDMNWRLGGGFAIFSNYAGSLLYGYHDITHKEKGDMSDIVTPFRVGDFYHVVNGIFDSQIGLRYDWTSCDCCYHLGFNLGFEQHWHPSQNQFLNFADNAMVGKFFINQGDLATHGFFLSVRFDF